MSVDIASLRAVRDMAKRGARESLNYDAEGFGCGDCDVEIEDEEFAVAAINAIIPRHQGGGGLLEELDQLRVAAARYAEEGADLQAHVSQLQAELDAARAEERAIAATVDRIEAAHPELIADIKALPATPPGPAPEWQGEVWAGIAEKQRAELERLRPLRDAGLKYLEAARVFNRLVDSDAILSSEYRAGLQFRRAGETLAFTDKDLRALLEVEEKIVREERAAKKDAP